MPYPDEQMLGIHSSNKNDNADGSKNSSEVNISDKDESNSVIESTQSADENTVEKVSFILSQVVA